MRARRLPSPGALVVIGVLVIAAPLVGSCGSGGGQPKSDPGAGRSTPKPSSAKLLQHPDIERAAAELVAAAEDAVLARAAPAGRQRILMPALASEGNEWEATALSGALLAAASALRPATPPTPLQSVPAIQGWLRGLENPQVAWVVEASGRRSVELRLHLVSDLRVWRSGPIPVQIPADMKWAWPAYPPDGEPLATLEVDEGELLREIDGELWIESRRGRQMVDYGPKGLELLDFRPWDSWGMSWLERWGDRPTHVARGAAVLRRDTAMVIAASDLPPGEGDVIGWSAWRGSSLAPMPLRRTMDDWLASYVAAPRIWGLASGWGVMQQHRAGGASITIFTAPLRRVPDARPRALQQMRAYPIGVDIVDSGEYFGAWGLWARAHAGARLARWVVGEGPVAEPGFEFESDEDGRVWRIRVPDLSGLKRKVWVEAMRSGLVDGAGDDPMLAPFATASIKDHDKRVVIEFEVPCPDLPARLCHPATALRHEKLEPRFATHALDPAADGRSIRMIARQDALSDVEIRFVPSIEERRQRFLLGDSQMMRNPGPWHGAQTFLPATEGPVATTPRSTYYRRSPSSSVTVFAWAGGPGGLGSGEQAMSAWLGGLGPRELMGVAAEEFNPKLPATGRPFTPVVAAASSSLPARVRLLVAPGADLAEVAARIEALLSSQGVAVELVDAAPGELPAAGEMLIGSMVLFSRQPLLRAQEWLGHLDAVPVGDADWQRAIQAPPGDDARFAEAASLEDDLVASGRWVVLWTQPGGMLLSRYVSGEDAEGGGPAPFLHETRYLPSTTMQAVLK